MAVYQGSLTVKRRPKDGGPGKPGKDGIDIQIDNPNLIVTEDGGSRDYSKTGFKIKVVQGGWGINYFGADMTVLQERSWTCEIIEVNNITGFTPPGPYPSGVTNAVFPPITGLSGDAGYIVLRLHIRDVDATYQFVDKRIQYTVTGRGYDGLPGQIPIQKEWVVGDTHRFNDEIKDFIYVRGASSDTSYWYTRTSKGDDIVAGAAPVGGANVEGYTRVDWLRTLAVNVLLAEEANLANFVFKDGKLLSIAGTVNGSPATYTGQAGFVHNIVLDGQTGKIYAEDAEITGTVNATSGVFTGALASPFERTKSTYTKDFSNNLIVTDSTFILPWDQLGSGRLIRLIQPNAGTPYCTAPTGKYFYEDGEQKNTLTMLGAEIVELLGYTDSQGNFTGWLVLNRGLLHTVSTWGEPHRIVAHGRVKTNDPFKYHTFDGSALSTSTGGSSSRRYTLIAMPTTWFDSTDGYYVKIIANGGDSAAFHTVEKNTNYAFAVYQHSLNVANGTLSPTTTFDFYFEIYSAAWLYPKSGGGGVMPGVDW